MSTATKELEWVDDVGPLNSSTRDGRYSVVGYPRDGGWRAFRGDVELYSGSYAACREACEDHAKIIAEQSDPELCARLELSVALAELRKLTEETRDEVRQLRKCLGQ